MHKRRRMERTSENGSNIGKRVDALQTKEINDNLKLSQQNMRRGLQTFFDTI